METALVVNMKEVGGQEEFRPFTLCLYEGFKTC